MKRVVIFTIGVLAMSGVGLVSCASNNGADVEKGKFQNTQLRYETDFSNIWEIVKAQFTTDRKQPTPKGEVPLKPVSKTQLNDIERDAIVRLNHSNILLKLDGKYVMTDPVFSDRASPVQWAGPKRFHESPITIAELPEIDVVIISHDHYDHLDKDSIKQLAKKTKTFVTPLKVGEYLKEWGVEARKIVELDWWQSLKVDELEFIATPSQHFSGRGLFDRDQTLWASWVIKSQQSNVFFSGDSGYFDGFKEIGERYGPFDLTLVETGAYNDLWSEIHMRPEESMQAHVDLQGKIMFPIHNGTFDLALHDWDEPFQRIHQLGDLHQVSVITPKFGEVLSIANADKEVEDNLWWQFSTETQPMTVASLAQPLLPAK